MTPMMARLGERRLLPGVELAPRCPARPAFPWPSSRASALWATPNPAHSAQTSGDRPVRVCACECSRARKWRSVNEMPHYNPLGADEWAWCTKTRPPRVGVGVKKPKRRRAGIREQWDIKCVSGHVIHRDEATMSSA